MRIEHYHAARTLLSNANIIEQCEHYRCLGCHLGRRQSPASSRHSGNANGQYETVSTAILSLARRVVCGRIATFSADLATE
jgi:hypothetical protein